MLLDVENIRKDFPILKVKVNGKPLVYFDNAATSQKPKRVIDALSDYYENYNANIHRSIHKLGEQATLAYENAHKKVAEFINSDPEEIVFTKGATESLNLVAYSLTENLKPNDEIILTQMEHHSNLVPWQQLAKKKNLKLNFVEFDEEGKLRLGQFEELLNKKTRVVSVVHMSNALGTINPVKEIAKTVKDAGADYMEFEYERIYTEEIVEKSAKMIGFENTRENFPLSLSQNILPEYTFERLKEKIRDVENYAKKIGLTLGFQPFYFPERLEEYYNRAPRGEHFCKHLFIPRIDCEGNVIFCFAIKKPFGNLTHQSFEEIWYGVELEHFREKFLSSGVLPICETCEKLVCLEKTRNMDGREVIELQTMPGKPNKDFIIER